MRLESEPLGKAVVSHEHVNMWEAHSGSGNPLENVDFVPMLCRWDTSPEETHSHPHTPTHIQSHHMTPMNTPPESHAHKPRGIWLLQGLYSEARVLCLQKSLLTPPLTCAQWEAKIRLKPAEKSCLAFHLDFLSVSQ